MFGTHNSAHDSTTLSRVSADRRCAQDCRRHKSGESRELGHRIGAVPNDEAVQRAPRGGLPRHLPRRGGIRRRRHGGAHRSLAGSGSGISQSGGAQSLAVRGRGNCNCNLRPRSGLVCRSADETK